MWRASFFIFMLLSGSITGLLFWQWKAYSEQTGESEELMQLSQHIAVESLQSNLKVTQTIKGLIPDREYRLIIPDTFFQWQCKSGQGIACDSGDDNPYTFLSNGKQMVFTYVLPMEKKQKAFLLNDWTVSVHGSEIKHSLITVSDSNRKDGTWAAGIPLKAHKEMELIDYYTFEGQGNTPSLYWQQAPLKKVSKSGFDVYIDHQKSVDLKAENLKNLAENSNISVVITNEYKKSYGKGILLTGPDTNNDELEQMLITLFYKGKFSYSPDIEDWLIDALGSQLRDRNAGTEKGNRLLNELRKELADDERQMFIRNMNAEDTLSIERLDKILGNIKGRETRFFAMNKQLNKPFVPLYFEYNRKVSFSGMEQKSINVIYKNGKQLLPLKEMAEAMGYKVEVLSDEETLFLAKGNNSYRFYLNKNFFIYNEEDYGLLENPLTNLNGTAFIEIQWLETLFNVSVEERNDELALTTALE